MPYKVHNELPGVGTTSKTLISVIYYNVCNVPALRHQERRKGCTGGNTPHLAALRHTRRAQRARRQYSTPGSIDAPGTAQRVHRLQHSTPGSIEAHQTGAKGTAATLHTWQHRDTRNGAKGAPAATLHTWQYRGTPGRRKGCTAATLHTWQHRGTRNSAKGAPAAILHTWQHRGTRRAQNKKTDGQTAAGPWLFITILFLLSWQGRKLLSVCLRGPAPLQLPGR